MPPFFNPTPRLCSQNRALTPPQVVIALLCFIFALQLWQLSALDLQPYDEGYYALRAKAIAQFGCWLNQADYAIGGFYSASHPPLHIWLMTISALLFGFSEFALRLPSLLMFALFLFVMARSAARSSLPNALTYALVVAGFLPLALWYARLAHLDSALMLFSLLEAHFYLRYIETRHRLFVFLAGAMLGAALLTKVLVGIFPALAIAIFELYRLLMRRATWKDVIFTLSIFFGIGLALGLSWFVWMCSANDAYFQRYLELFLTDRIGRNQTFSQYRTGAVYYLNVILTRVPLSATSLLWFWTFFRHPEFRAPYRVLWLIWFVLTFLVLSLAQTKLLWYALLFVPPLVLITAESLAMLFAALRNGAPKTMQVTLAGLLLASLWSLTQPLHRDTMDAVLAHRWSDVATALGLLFGVVGLSAAGWWLFWRLQARESVLLSLILAVSFIAAAQTAFYGLPFVQTYAGGKAVGEYVQRRAPCCLIHLAPQKRFDEKSFNPQLSYYLNGLDVNAQRWGAQTRYVYLSLADTARLAAALSASSDALLLVEKTAQTRPRLAVELVNEFAPTAQRIGAQLVLDTPNYAVYELPSAAQGASP